MLNRAQYARGNQKVCLGALLNVIIKLSGVHMIRPQHLGEASGSPVPPLTQSDWIKVRLKNASLRFNQIVNFSLYGHCFLPL